jgi:hypothetical protein
VSKSGSYYPIAPTRFVDTRYADPGPKGPLTSRGCYTFQIGGKQIGSSTPVPASAIAVTANVTVTSQTALGWLYLGLPTYAAPTASTINFPKGDNRANGVTVPLSSAGTVGAWYGAAAGTEVNVIIDVTGYFLPGTGGAGYVAFGPTRILDTRPAPDHYDPIGLAGSLTSGKHRLIQVAGVQGLPATGIVAVTGNLTVIAPSVKGWVSLGPDPTDSPGSSTINFARGDIRANNVVVPVNADGTLSAFYSASGGVTTATVNLVLDISGYFTATGGALYNTLEPTRILDSRTDTGLNGPLATRVAQTLQVVGSVVPSGVPSGSAAITANLTVTEQSGAGFAAVGPTIDATTTFSNLNFPRGDDRANGVTVPLASDGSLMFIYVGPTGTHAQLLLDVTGYYKGNA